MVPSSSLLLQVPSSSQQCQHRSSMVLLASSVSDTSSTSQQDKQRRTTVYDPSQAFMDGEPPPDILSMMNQYEDDESFSSSSDIIRDLDGQPLTPQYFADTMGIDRVDSFSCVDDFRGFMSNACRVHLHPGGETAFYKRIVFEELDHAREKSKTAPFKLARDAKSSEVVVSFLSSRACQQLTETAGVLIPKCYDAHLRPHPTNPMESKFSFLLEDLSPAKGWYQQWLLHDMQDCQATLTMYAKVHAFFWQGSSFWEDSEAATELEDAVWKSGSYVQPQAQNEDQCSIVASEWKTKRMKFEKELSDFDYWDNLGERLQSVAKDCGRLAHPFADESESSSEASLSDTYQAYRTFTHGDPKQANLLFRRGSPKDTEELQVGLIDFQWSGFGLASSDVAHFLTSAVHADRLVDGGEETFLRYYYEELQTYLVEYGAFSAEEDARKGMDFSTFLDQYETAILDICRLVIAYTWDRFDEPVDKDNQEGCARTMNKTSYNKSIPNVVWLMSKCDEILKKRGI